MGLGGTVVFSASASTVMRTAAPDWRKRMPLHAKGVPPPQRRARLAVGARDERLDHGAALVVQQVHLVNDQQAHSGGHRHLRRGSSGGSRRPWGAGNALTDTGRARQRAGLSAAERGGPPSAAARCRGYGVRRGAGPQGAGQGVWGRGWGGRRLGRTSPPLRVMTSHFSGVVTIICVSASSFLLSCMSPVSSRTDRPAGGVAGGGGWVGGGP